MSLTGAIEGRAPAKENLELTTDPKGTEVSFDTVINELEKSGRIDLFAASRTLDKLKESVGDTEINGIKDILEKLLKTKDYNEINKYINELQIIIDIHNKEEGKTKSEAAIEGHELGIEIKEKGELEKLFNTVIHEFESRDKLDFYAAGVVLTRLRNSLSGLEIDGVKDKLLELYNESKPEKINELLLDIQKYAKEAEKERSNAVIEQLNQVELDDSFDMPEDFDDLIEQYDDAISDLRWRLGKNISPFEDIFTYEYQLGPEISSKERKEIKKAIELLESSKKALEKSKEKMGKITGDFISTEIDKAVMIVSKQPSNQEIEVKLFGEDITFDSKEQALEALKKMKIELSEEFVSYTKDFFKTIFFFYGNVLTGVGNAFYSSEKAIGTDMLDRAKHDVTGVLDFDNIILVSELLLAGLVVPGTAFMAMSLFYMPHAGVGESIYRRGRDIFSRYSSDMQIEDYGRNSTIIPALNTEEGKEYLEYKQRQGLMELLYQKLDTDFTPGTPEYIKFQNYLRVLEGFKLTKNSPTFYYIANKLVNGMDLGFKSNFSKALGFNLRTTFLSGSSLYYPGKYKFKIIPTSIERYPFEPSQQLYSKMLKQLDSNSVKLEEGLKLFFTGKTVKTEQASDKKTELKIEGADTKTETYNNLLSYIEAKDISESEKIKLKQRFIQYVDRLGSMPKGANIIQRDIYLMLETDYLTKDDLLTDLSKEINKAELDTSTARKITDVLAFDKIKSKLGLLRKFEFLIQNGEWVGSIDDYKDTIKDIESGKGIKPNIKSKLSSINFESEFKDIRDSGENIGEKQAEIRKKLFSSVGENIDYSTKTELLIGIENYVDYRVNEKIETDTRNNLNKFLEKILSGDISFENEDELLKEVDRIIKGNLPKYKMLNILGKIKVDKLSESARIKHKKILDLVKKGFENGNELYISEKELNELVGYLKKGDVSLISLNGQDFDKTDLLEKIEKSKELHTDDFYKKLGVEQKQVADKLKYLNDYTDLIGKLDQNSDIPTMKDEFNKFIRSIQKGNSFTNTEAIKIIEGIFGINGTSIDTFDNLKDKFNSITLDNNSSIDNLDKKFIDSFIKKFESLDIDKQISLLSSYKGQRISAELENILKNLIDETILRINSIDNIADKVVKANELKNSLPIAHQIDTINDIISKENLAKFSTELNQIKSALEKVDNKKDLAELKRRFDSVKNVLLSNNSITTDTEFDKLQSEIERMLIDKKEELKTGKASAETKETMTLDEKIKTHGDLYDRAIKQAELSGNIDLAEELFKEKQKGLRDFKSIKIDGLEASLKSRLGGVAKLLTSPTLTKKLAIEADTIMQDLVTRGVVKEVDGEYIFKGELDNLKSRLRVLGHPDLLHYLKKSLKTGK